MPDFEVFSSTSDGSFVVGMSEAGDYVTNTLLTFSTTTGASLSSVYQSNSQTISGLGEGLETFLSVTGGTLVINGVDVGGGGDVTNGDSIRLSTVSSASYLATTTVVLSSLGEEVSRWDITTYAQPIDLSPGDNLSGSDLLYNLINSGVPVVWW